MASCLYTTGVLTDVERVENITMRVVETGLVVLLSVVPSASATNARGSKLDLPVPSCKDVVAAPEVMLFVCRRNWVGLAALGESLTSSLGR